MIGMVPEETLWHSFLPPIGCYYLRIVLVHIPVSPPLIDFPLMMGSRLVAYGRDRNPPDLENAQLLFMLQYSGY